MSSPRGQVFLGEVESAPNVTAVVLADEFDELEAEKSKMKSGVLFKDLEDAQALKLAHGWRTWMSRSNVRGETLINTCWCMFLFSVQGHLSGA